MDKTFVSYLHRLKFDPKLRQTIHAKYMVNMRLVFLFILTILAVGITSLFTLPRRLNPEIKLAIVQVATVLPGAGPTDVESLVTIPLEDKLSGVKGLDTITSVSSESFSYVAMQFHSGVDKEKARTDVQAAVSEVTSLPADAQTPKVEALDFEHTPIWTFSVTSSSDVASLMRFSQSLKDAIKQIPNVDRVDLTGDDTQQIQIIVSPQKVQEQNLNPLLVAAAVKNATRAFPAGSAVTSGSSFSLAIDQQATSVEDIRNIHLVVGGVPVKLGDIASVGERSKKDQKKTYLATKNNPLQRAVTFSVFKSSSADIDKTVKVVESFVKKTVDGTAGRYQVTSVTNSGEEIGKQLTDLVSEFGSTLLLVFINLLLFLGIKQALIAIMTIPLTFLMAFAWMNMFGQSINFLTLFALLLAFGTSIDDTIVTVSAMTKYYRTGKFTPHETGMLVWRDFIVPIWTTTVTTVWAFLPLLLSSGIIGEFIKPIPLVVATTMYTSTAVAWFITLPMMIILLKLRVPRRIVFLIQIIVFFSIAALLIVVSPKNILLVPIFALFGFFLFVGIRERMALVVGIKRYAKRHAWMGIAGAFGNRLFTQGLISTDRVSHAYRNLILRILGSKRGRRVTLICLFAFAFSSYLLVPLGLVRNEFFPKTNTDAVFVNLELPSGTNLSTIDEETRAILNDLRQTPETTAVVADTGSQARTGFGGGSGGGSGASFTVILTPKEKRKTDSSVIAQVLRKKYETYTKGKISVVEESGGPPAGADVQIKLLGDDLPTLGTYAQKVVAFLEKQPGAINVDTSVKAGTSKLVFVPDKIKVAQAGLSIDTLGFWLRTSASGFTLDSVKFNSKDEDVIFYTTSDLLHPEDLGTITVPTSTGNVSLLSLGTIKLETNPTVITREGGKRTISVSAGVLPGYSVSAINKKLAAFAQDRLALPANYTWKTGGVNEENQKSVSSIIRAMGLSFLLIMATMVVEFSSYRQAAMILSLIPFAISGVFIVFGLSGTPLSFPALIGVMALFGVVVTNAMFIVEKINQNRKQGMTLDHAIADAGGGRLEPILLTSITSILGLIPITLANPLWRGLGGAIIAGLLFSGVIMLFYIPVVYFMIYRSQK